MTRFKRKNTFSKTKWEGLLKNLTVEDSFPDYALVTSVFEDFVLEVYMNEGDKEITIISNHFITKDDTFVYYLSQERLDFLKNLLLKEMQKHHEQHYQTSTEKD